MKGTPHGVEVGDLRILHSIEDRPLSGLRWALAAVVAAIGYEEVAHWHVLTVRDRAGNEIASRRFTTERKAQRARESFVEVVGGIAHDTYKAAHWQSVLDAV